MANGSDYRPYLSRDDAVEEYKSLRNEIIESQKQRILLLQYSLVLIAALFGYLVTKSTLSPPNAFFLIVLTIVPSLFSYSTRCRERRIAQYLQVFLGALTPWSKFSSSNSLGFFGRSSTVIVVLMILLDIVFLGLAWPLSSLAIGSCISMDQALGLFALVVVALNALLAWRLADLPDYLGDIKKVHNELINKAATSSKS